MYIRVLLVVVTVLVIAFVLRFREARASVYSVQTGSIPTQNAIFSSSKNVQSAIIKVTNTKS